MYRAALDHVLKQAWATGGEPAVTTIYIGGQSDAANFGFAFAFAMW